MDQPDRFAALYAIFLLAAPPRLSTSVLQVSVIIVIAARPEQIPQQNPRTDPTRYNDVHDCILR